MTQSFPTVRLPGVGDAVASHYVALPMCARTYAMCASARKVITYETGAVLVKCMPDRSGGQVLLSGGLCVISCGEIGMFGVSIAG
ncbi:unnamed protein product [Onchocerca flexuosa]|uniref:Oxidoreductase n=1 Tax=Onchocerca flexuosa TaxID=387005 RepID=A0A183I6F9_9BILA|nr:unnamed protein product [Onchocerca flexuosa]